jgi:hypothetical protein
MQARRAAGGQWEALRMPAAIGHLGRDRSLSLTSSNSNSFYF